MAAKQILTSQHPVKEPREVSKGAREARKPRRCTKAFLILPAMFEESIAELKIHYRMKKVYNSYYLKNRMMEGFWKKQWAHW
jgi:hypothetical protein